MKMKIKNFLFLFLFFCIMIPSSIAILFAHSFAKQTIQEEYTKNYMEAISSEIQTNFSLLLFQLNNTFLQLMTDQELFAVTQEATLDFSQRYDELEPLFSALLDRTQTVSMIDFITIDGTLYHFGPDTSGFPPPEDSFLSALGRHQFLFSENAVRSGEKTYNIVGRKLYNYKKNMELGSVVFYIDGINLRSLYAISPNERNLFFISMGDTIIFHPDESYIGSKLYLPKELISNTQQSLLSESDYILTEYALESPSIQTPLTITCILSNDATFQKMNQLIWVLLTSYVLMLFLAFFLSTLLSSRLIRRLSRLRDSMEHFSLNEPPVVQASPSNEIAALEISFQKMTDEIHRLIFDIKQEKEKQRIAEIKALQSQINPHFIYNALDSISWKAKENHLYEIDDMIVTLATFFRIGLHKGDDMITVYQEVEHVKSYLEIEAIRFPKLFTVTWEIDETTYDCLTPKIILQPVVENSIKHGFSGMQRGGKIRIRNWRQGDDLLFEISDNGRGISLHGDQLPPSSSKEGGYGLHNINERLMRYYGKEYRLHIHSQSDGGTAVRLRIRYQKADETL